MGGGASMARWGEEPVGLGGGEERDYKCPKHL